MKTRHIGDGGSVPTMKIPLVPGQINPDILGDIHTEALHTQTLMGLAFSEISQMKNPIGCNMRLSVDRLFALLAPIRANMDRIMDMAEEPYIVPSDEEMDE